MLHQDKSESNHAINLLLEWIMVRERVFELSVLEGDEVISLIEFIRNILVSIFVYSCFLFICYNLYFNMYFFAIILYNSLYTLMVEMK